MVIASFVFFLLIFFGIGIFSITKAQGSREDYYLAGNSVPAWLTGLSAIATQNSGFAFIGFIGFTHIAGFSAIWVLLGAVLGDFFGSLFIHRRLREITEKTKEASFLSVLARWDGENYTIWPRIAGIITIIFLGAYATAQITAGSKALEGVLGWHPHAGSITVALMVMVYSMAGGIRASIWTDAAQAIVMLAAMFILLMTCMNDRGGLTQSIAQLQTIPGYLDIQPSTLAFPGISGIALFIMGWLFYGFSVVGQPHIMVRFMTMQNADQMIRVRLWYYGYFIILFVVALGVGLISRLYIEQLGGVDPELTLPRIAVKLLPPYLVGLILAGMFAATMSTADSLILSCSATLTHDILPRQLERPWELKAATAIVTLVALSFALIEVRSVFNMVILAWSAIASSFGPLITLKALNRKIDETTAIGMMVAGLGVSLAWRMFDLHLALYEGFPGIITGLIIGWLFSVQSNKASNLTT